MRCIIGVISSPGTGYDDMKNIWFENVNEFNKRSDKDKVYLFFLEGHKRHDRTQYAIEQISENHIYKFKANCEEKFENLLLILTPPIKNLYSGYRKVTCTIPFQSKNRGRGFCWYSLRIQERPNSKLFFKMGAKPSSILNISAV